jgi:hypothetical protein
MQSNKQAQRNSTINSKINTLQYISESTQATLYPIHLAPLKTGQTLRRSWRKRSRETLPTASLVAETQELR